jgi:hypothetical protein
MNTKAALIAVNRIKKATTKTEQKFENNVPIDLAVASC